MISNFILAEAETQAQTQQLPWWMLIVYVVGFGALIYFLMIRPQRKQKKKDEELRNNIQVGDEITTIGGITGKIVSIKEDSFVIENVDHSKVKIMKWAVQTNNTIHDQKA